MIQREQYEQIWELDNISYLFTSVWFSEEFLKKDFIVIIEKEKWFLFLEKNERKKIGNLGEKILKQGTNKFNKKYQNILKQEPKELRISDLSNPELNKYFTQIINFIQKLCNLYLFTEYFFYDSIKNFQNLEVEIKEMQEQKYLMRKKLNKYLFGKDCVLHSLSDEISKRFNLKNISEYHYKELIQILENKKVTIPRRDILVTGKVFKWSPLVGEKANQIISKLKTEENMNVNEIKGIIASKGIHKGRVIIMPFSPSYDYNKKTNKMKKGDILVAVSTGPEMMAACLKAGAIVTDEGGICSHASIVSRELKIPCIIGTKIATKILKDGDLVELDANKGIIKILKN